ncbi:tetratricopeptide repeat protein [Echinicola vietnamensis]|uniref:Tetratricopeptide repeat protein n=1 Tax=Echinicola vietnamensis (strain DSM 17526 / LMG 23754 / KMM 6221) TaxID=926556 RepID=L0G3A8_ECHVK|nr:tetratricopeptide repeat protein [Echinicola vietnamensis]AGA79798.1 tetratricopeptide repeat protein [Echinicola vietnamensis DSM 17526]
METKRAIELNNQGARHFLNGEFEQAVSCYEEAYKLYPENTSLLNNMGLYYHQQKDFEKAVAYFEQAIALEDKASYRINAGNAMAMQGKLDEARKQYQATAKKFPKAVGAWLSLARLATHQNRLEDAKAYWNEVVQLAPKPDHYLQLAKVMILQKDMEPALELLYAIVTKSENPETWFHIGRCEFHLRNHGLAENALKKALASSPDHAEFRYYLAINHLAKGDTQEGLAQLDILLKYDSENPEILTEKGVILSSIHRYEEALSLFDKALKIKPGFSKAQHYKNLVENQTS